MNKSDIIELLAYTSALVFLLVYLLYILSKHLTYEAIARDKDKRRKEFLEKKAK
jgi:hypothetical protein